jgi:hypothetical protein
VWCFLAETLRVACEPDFFDARIPFISFVADTFAGGADVPAATVAPAAELPPSNKAAATAAKVNRRYMV